MHTERARLATITKLKSGSWRVEVRRKGKYVNDTFLGAESARTCWQSFAVSLRAIAGPTPNRTKSISPPSADRARLFLRADHSERAPCLTKSKIVLAIRKTIATRFTAAAIAAWLLLSSERNRLSTKRGRRPPDDHSIMDRQDTPSTTNTG